MSSPRPDDATPYEVPGEVRATGGPAENAPTPADVKGGPGRSTLVSDLLASVVVFLVALPLCMGIALASGVPVAAGLLTGIIGGLVVGALAGSPLQVSGPAAGLAVIIYQFVRETGLEFLGLAVLIGGVLQAVAGVFKVGVWFRAVSPAVVEGMLAGIGVLIFASQFHVMVDDDPRGSGVQNLLSIPEAVAKGLPLPRLAARETRDLVADNVRAAGTLHEAQVQILETLQEHRDSEGLEGDFDLSDTLARQEAVAEGLGGIAGRLEGTTVLSGERGPRRSAALTDALAAVSAAMNSLRTSEPDAKAVIASQKTAAASLLAFEKTLKNHDWAAKVGLLTLAVIVLWRFLPRPLSVVPSPLAAIVAATAAAAWLSLPVLYVEVPDSLMSEIHWPTAALLERADWGAVIKAGVVIAVVASAETLLCATAVDAMHTGPRTNYDKELFAQGVGNTICGAIGSLPMTGVIVRSSANVQAGGKTRLSAILHGAWLLGLVAMAPTLLRMIPVSALAAILVFTGLKLMNLGKLRRLWTVGKSEAFVFLATVVTIVATDLLTGVLVGIGLAGAILLRKFSKLRVTSETSGADTTIKLDGAATFIGLPKLAEQLDEVPPGSHVNVDVERLSFMDHACLELLQSFETQHKATGGTLNLDWRGVPRKP